MLSLSIHIAVFSLSRTERFYRDGLGLHTTRVGSLEEGYVIIQGEDATWEIIAEPWMTKHLAFPNLYPPDSPPEGTGTGVQFSISVRPLDAKFKQACAAGGVAIRQPFDSSEGQRSAMIGDPDGYLVLLTGSNDDE